MLKKRYGDETHALKHGAQDFSLVGIVITGCVVEAPVMGSRVSMRKGEAPEITADMYWWRLWYAVNKERWHGHFGRPALNTVGERKEEPQSLELMRKESEEKKTGETQNE